MKFVVTSPEINNIRRRRWRRLSVTFVRVYFGPICKFRTGAVRVLKETNVYDVLVASVNNARASYYYYSRRPRKGGIIKIIFGNFRARIRFSA